MNQPTWMQQISNSTVCNFFYFFFILYAVIFVFSLILVVGTLLSLKKFGPMEISLSVQTLVTTFIAGSFMMFYYIICDRALMPLKNAKPDEPFMVYNTH